MAEYFEPSPRASKRRRSNTSTLIESTPESGIKYAGLSGVTNTLSNLSKRIFKSRQSEQSEVQDDSGYGSKDGSFTDENMIHENRRPSLTEMEMERVEDEQKIQGSQSEMLEAEDSAIERDIVSTNTEEEEIDTAPQIRSSGRERRRPRRFSNDTSPKKGSSLVSDKKISSQHSALAENMSPEVVSNHRSPQKLKGILTPSKRKQATPKKVLFDKSPKTIESEFGFKDIVMSTKKSKQKASRSDIRPHKAVEDTDQIQGSTEDVVVVEIDQLPTSLEPEELLQSVEPPEAFVPPLLTEPAEFEADPSFLSIKAQVLRQMTSSTTVQITHLENQHKTLHSLLSATIVAGESNSLLLLGPRGSGKSLLVDTAINDLTSKYKEDFHVVRLNGIFQTDDKLALREIWRQLGQEMHIPEDETGEIQTYADTMASLLSLLSHPEELADPNSMVVDGPEEKAAKSIIFVLDEFDLFTTHPRQTLLYNLFDIAQARKAPIAVIGCTTRMDVIDSLEKRVKSRFSHRWLHLPSMKSLHTLEEAARSNLCLKDNGIEALGLTKEELTTRAKWNEYITTTFLSSQSVQAKIKQIFYTTKSIPDLLTALYIPIATSSMSALTSTIIPPSTQPPSILNLLPNLPTLHLSLLVAASRLETIHNITTMNFNLVYAHYSELLTRSRTQHSISGAKATGAGLKKWSEDAARGAWEELGIWELLVPVTGGGSKGAGEFGDAVSGAGMGGGSGQARMWRVDVNLEEVAWAVKEKLGVNGGIGEVLGRWCREI